MRKKLFAAMMAVALCVSAVPASQIHASALTEGEGAADDAYDDGGEADPVSGEIELGDIVVSPAKKTIKVGQSFSISIEASLGSDYEDLPDEEWEEICDNNIDSIEFRSTKTSVASVNKKTGKVRGLKKGNAVIKTTVNLVNGQTATLKTKVYVTK